MGEGSKLSVTSVIAVVTPIIIGQIDFSVIIYLFMQVLIEFECVVLHTFRSNKSRRSSRCFFVVSFLGTHSNFGKYLNKKATRNPQP